MLWSPDALWLLVGALALDALVGDPDWLWRRLPHPVVGLGAGVAWLDRRLNREAWSLASRRAAGVAALVVLVGASFALGAALDALLRRLPGGAALVALAASIFLAQRSLYDHVARVRDAFAADGLTGARRAVSMIVGRDPEGLDEAGVCRAAIESCAENFSDGVAAPAFWFALLGLPGLVAYKAVNTADSMIGHRTPRHAAFGWAAARFDDALNLVPARLSGLLMALAGLVVGAQPASALAVMRRDAPRHRSPNAGWPEAAMAAALGLALAGPRRYGAHVVDDPFLNPDGRTAARPDDIARALRIFVAACVLHAGLYAGIAIALP
jgi:adenosylcobinamide-phosphate synthase